MLAAQFRFNPPAATLSISRPGALQYSLQLVDPHRTAIERGLGDALLPVLEKELDDFMGDRYEAAFREHLVRLAALGELGEEIVDIGRWWRDAPAVEIDAVALAGRARRPVLVGEAKWARRVDGGRIRRHLERKADALPGHEPDRLRYAVCAREQVSGGDELLVVTATDIFAPDV